jgi:hypothetical protein
MYRRTEKMEDRKAKEKGVEEMLKNIKEGEEDEDENKPNGSDVGGSWEKERRKSGRRGREEWIQKIGDQEIKERRERIRAGATEENKTESQHETGNRKQPFVVSR